MTLAEFLALPSYTVATATAIGLAWHCGGVKALQDEMRDVLRQRQDAIDSIESMRDAAREQAEEHEAAALQLLVKADVILEGCADGNAVPALAVLALEIAARHKGQAEALRTQSAVADGILQRPEFREIES